MTGLVRGYIHTHDSQRDNINMDARGSYLPSNVSFSNDVHAKLKKNYIRRIKNTKIKTQHSHCNTNLNNLVRNTKHYRLKLSLF